MKVEVQGMTPYSLPPPYPVSTPGLSNMRSDYWSSEDKVSFQLSLCKISNFPLTKPLLLFIQHFSDSDGGSWTWHTWWMKYISIYWKSATNLIEYKFAVLLKVFSSVRSFNSHSVLLVTQHQQPLFQITPVLNTGLSLSDPLQLYQGQSLDSSVGYMYTLWVQEDITARLCKLVQASAISCKTM